MRSILDTGLGLIFGPKCSSWSNGSSIDYFRAEGIETHLGMLAILGALMVLFGPLVGSMVGSLAPVAAGKRFPPAPVLGPLDPHRQAAAATGKRLCKLTGSACK